jgi:hypothetical protein
MSRHISPDYVLPPHQQARVERLEDDVRDMRKEFGDMKKVLNALVDVVRAFAFVCVAPHAIAAASSRRSQTEALHRRDGEETTVNTDQTTHRCSDGRYNEPEFVHCAARIPARVSVAPVLHTFQRHPVRKFAERRPKGRRPKEVYLAEFAERGRSEGGEGSAGEEAYLAEFAERERDPPSSQNWSRTPSHGGNDDTSRKGGNGGAAGAHCTADSPCLTLS